MNAANVSGMKQSWSTFWGARDKRERRMLIAAAVAVVLGLIYSLLIDPALRGRADLEKKLPDLRQQAAEVQALAKDAAALSGKNAVPPPAITRESIESALTRKGLKAQSITVSGELAKVQLNAVSFSATVEWLNDMQRAARLSVTEAVIEAQAQPDTVNAGFTLRQPRGEGQ